MNQDNIFMPTDNRAPIFQIIVLVLALVFTTKFFQSTPLEVIFFQLHAGFLGLVLLFLIAYILSLVTKRKTINKTVFYFIMLIFFMPIYSAYRSNVEFGQPFFYGLASQRGWLMLGAGVWFYYIIISKKISLSTIEHSFLIMSLASLIVFSFFYLTFDPSQLTGEESFARMTEDRGLRLKFQNFFITFGALYYFIKYSIYRKPIDLLIFLTFLAFIVFIVQGRTYMIFLAGTFLLYYYFNFPISKFLLNIIKVFLFLLATLVLVNIFMPDYLERMGKLFIDMFTVLGGEKSQDTSANARIWTTEIVLDYFHAHPFSIWLGTGRVSHHWNDGYERLFGYFYPEDIGILGGLFLYGVFGIILLVFIPLFLEIKEIKKAKGKDNIFIITIKYMLILSIVKLIQSGLYFGANIWIILFFILYGYNRLNKDSCAT